MWFFFQTGQQGEKETHLQTSESSKAGEFETTSGPISEEVKNSTSTDGNSNLFYQNLEFQG